MRTKAAGKIFIACIVLFAGCYLSTGASFMMDGASDRVSESDPGSVCGNSILEEGEECDDGNRTPLDGCDASCRIENCVPSTEICNGEDDDCDGSVDEDGVCACTDPQALTVLHRDSLPGPGDAADPSIVWNGTEYGMAWTTGFARIDRGGHLIEHRSSYSFSGSSSADIAWSSAMNSYIFCWASGTDVYCGIQSIGSEPMQRVMAVDREHGGISYNNPRALWNPTYDEMAIIYPFGYYGAQTFFLSRTDVNWNSMGEPVEVNQHTGLHIWYVVAVWTGEAYAIVYMGAENEIYFSRFNGQGVRMDPDLLVSTFPDFEYLSDTLLWDGSTFLVGLSDFANIFLLRFDAHAAALSMSQVSRYDGSILVYIPVMAQGQWTGIVWNDLDGSDWDSGPHHVIFNVVDYGGEPLRDPIVLTDRGIYPWIASDGETYLVAWREGDIWDPEIVFVRIGCP